MSKAAEKICASVPEAYRAHAMELVDDLTFQKKKLEETRLGLENSPLVIAYNNGGGQAGIRRNPGFDAYNALVKTYLQTLNALQEILGKQAPSTPKMLEFRKYAQTIKKVAQ